MDNNKQQQQQKENVQRTVACTTTHQQKSFQIYELLNKIQNVINTDSLVPQFIYSTS